MRGAGGKNHKKDDISSGKRAMNKGAWTAEEDKRLSDYINLHGPKKWKTVALRAGLNRCGKSCRLRWLNYLRPNIKRGNISHEEEDLILRLHKLLGNRWSLIAGRLPGRTDNEIKNYWNSHLSKKVNQMPKKMEIPPPPISVPVNAPPYLPPDTQEDGGSQITFDVNDLFDFSTDSTFDLDWVNNFLQLDHLPNNFPTQR